MTICPCCGFKSANSEHGISSEACLSCGAHAVGEPLPRPEHELPSYARSLMLTVSGSLLVLALLVQTIIAFAQKAPVSVQSVLATFSTLDGFWSLMGAAETAAWRLKWIMIPITIVVLFGARRLYRSMLATPERFCGQGYARSGYLASAAVPLLVLILIGITVPERLQQRQDSIQAAVNADIYRMDRAQDEYRQKYGTLPDELNDLLKGLPDADGTLAAALKNIGPADYTPNSEVAAVPTKKPQTLRGAVILNASVAPAAEESISGGISFTNYELRLSGVDRLLNTDDDLIVRDGVTYKVSEIPKRGVSATSAAQKRRP